MLRRALTSFNSLGERLHKKVRRITTHVHKTNDAHNDVGGDGTAADTPGQQNTVEGKILCQKRRRPSNQHPTEATTGHSWSSSSAGRLSVISPRRRVTLQMSFSRRHPSPAWTEWGVSTRQHGRPPWQNLSPSRTARPPDTTHRTPQEKRQWWIRVSTTAWSLFPSPRSR